MMISVKFIIKASVFYLTICCCYSKLCLRAEM